MGRCCHLIIGNHSFQALLGNIAKKETNNDPTHLFFIGLAYLRGIDVERDAERAISLISMAAKAELPEALEMLVNIYMMGDGVKRNLKKADEYQKKLVSIRLQTLEKDKSDENAQLCCDALVKLFDLASTRGLKKNKYFLDYFFDSYCSFVETITEYDWFTCTKKREPSYSQKRNDILLAFLMGKLLVNSTDENKRQKGLEYLLDALDDAIELNKSDDIVGLAQSIEICTFVALAYMSRKEFSEAEEYFDIAMRAVKKLDALYPDDKRVKKAYVRALSDLLLFYLNAEEYEKSVDILSDALKRAEDWYKEVRTEESLEMMIDVYLSCARLFTYVGNFEIAEKLFIASITACEGLSQVYNYRRIRNILSSLAKFYELEERYKEAIDAYDRALSIDKRDEDAEGRYAEDIEICKIIISLYNNLNNSDGAEKYREILGRLEEERQSILNWFFEDDQA